MHCSFAYCKGSGSGEHYGIGYLPATRDNNPSSPLYGRIYLTGNGVAPDQGTFTSFSSDGVVYSAPVRLTATQRDVNVIVAPYNTNPFVGTVYLIAMDEGGGGLGTRTNYFYRSTDGGVTWSTGIQMGPGFPAPGVGTDGHYAKMFPGAWRYQGDGQLGVSPDGTVHYAFTQHGPGGDPGDIMYVRSTDNGTSWSSPMRVNTDTGSAAQWQPSLAVATNGAMYIGWYDTRNGGQCTPGVNTPCYERRGRVSLDGGLTWQADQAVSDVVSPLPVQPDPNLPATYAGDYNYAIASGTDILETWVDGRNLINGQSQEDVYLDKISLAASPTPTSTPTSTPTPIGMVNGHLTWQGIVQPNSHNTLVTGTLVLCNGSSAVYNNTNLHTDQNGNFSVITGLPDGVYTWKVKGGRHLRNAGNLTISGGSATFEAGTERAGDVNGDNVVNATDFNILKSNFGQIGDRPSDFNFDNVTNSTDFTLLKNVFGQAGMSGNCP